MPGSVRLFPGYDSFSTISFTEDKEVLVKVDISSKELLQIKSC